MAPLSDAAQRLGQVVGALRDIDVLIDEVVAEAAGARASTRRRAPRSTARWRRAARPCAGASAQALAAPESAGFLFDLGAFIEARGWLAPTGLLPDRAARRADRRGRRRRSCDKRRRKVRKRGRRIRELDAEGLHELRKELKKLRYAVDMLGPIYKAAQVAGYLRTLKDLQDSFGSLNDAAMARACLTGPEAPAPADPAAQRAVGWTLGTLAVRVADDRPASSSAGTAWRRRSPSGADACRWRRLARVW